MCLGVPGKVVEIFTENGLPMGRIDYAGTLATACLAYVPEIRVGQYTVVHAGFAISIIDEEEAARTFDAFRELEEAMAARGVDIFGNPRQGGQGNEGDALP